MYFSILTIFPPVLSLPWMFVGKEMSVHVLLFKKHFTNAFFFLLLPGRHSREGYRLTLERKTNFLVLGSGTQYVYRMEMEGHRQDSSLPNSIMHLFPTILEQCRSLLYLCCDDRIESEEACIFSQGTDNPTQKGNSSILFPALEWKG